MTVNFTPQLLASSTYVMSDVEKANTKELQKDASVLGIFLALNTTTNKQEPCYITMTGNENKKDFLARRLSDNQLVGKVEAFPYQLHKGGFGNPLNDVCLTDPNASICDDRKMYGAQNFVPKVFIDHLYTSTAAPNSLKHRGRRIVHDCYYKGIGSHLIYAIQTVYKNQFEGRLDVQASHSAHAFYRKMGFSSANVEIDAKLDQIAGPLEDSSHFMAIIMFLPEDNRQAWLKIVTDHPFGFQLEESPPAQSTQLSTSTDLNSTLP